MKELGELTARLNINVCFDAVAGPLTGLLLAGMPAQSSVLIYGSLSLTPIADVNPKDLLFYGKRLEGFWMKNSPIFQPTEIREAMAFIIQDLKTGGALFKHKIAKQIKLEDCQASIDGYKKTATEGKTIFRPNLP